METVITTLQAFLQIYIIVVLVWMLISWLPMISPSLAYNGTVVGIRNFADSVVLPYVRLFRFVPPVRMGGSMLDLSALVAILTLQIGGSIIIGLLANLTGV